MFSAVFFSIYRHPGALRRKLPAVVQWRSLSRIRMPKKDKVRHYFSDPFPGFISSSILYFSVLCQYYIMLRFVPKKISKLLFYPNLPHRLYRDTELETLFNIKYKTNKKLLIDKRSFFAFILLVLRHILDLVSWIKKSEKIIFRLLTCFGCRWEQHIRLVLELHILK